MDGLGNRLKVGLALLFGGASCKMYVIDVKDVDCTQTCRRIIMMDLLADPSIIVER